MTKTSIEWTERSWNPIVGCSILSPGCTHCYAMPLAFRIEKMNEEARQAGHKIPAPQYEGTTKLVNSRPVWTSKLALSEKTLLEPLRRKKPALYFVNSMGDLFHEKCPDEWIDAVFAVMALTPQHTYQVLTKRAARMLDYFSEQKNARQGIPPLREFCVHGLAQEFAGRTIEAPQWPLPNVWLGVSAERQQEADARIPHLLATPAAVRFVSLEPLLGPIDLTALTLAGVLSHFDALRHGASFTPHLDGTRAYHSSGNPTLDWVIVGGESGKHARPMHPDWPRRLRDQCATAGVAFFFKQWGGWYPIIDRDRDDPDWRKNYSLAREHPDRYRICNFEGGQGFHGERVHLMRRYDKKAAGRTLDGVTHDGLPDLAAGAHGLTAPARRLQQVAHDSLNRPLAEPESSR